MVSEGSNEKVEQVEYNLSSFKIMHIAELIRTADTFYLVGATSKAFFRWQCIFFHIKSRLNPKEINCSNRIRINFHRFHENVSLKKMKSMKNYYYEEYECHLQNMLKKYGFDMKEKESQEHLV